MKLFILLLPKPTMPESAELFSAKIGKRLPSLPIPRTSLIGRERQGVGAAVVRRRRVGHAGQRGVDVGHGFQQQL